MSDRTDSAKEGKLNARLGASTLAAVEVAIAKGFEIAAIVLLRPSPARESCKYLFVTNTLADPEVTAAFSEELEAHGFPRSVPDAVN